MEALLHDICFLDFRFGPPAELPGTDCDGERKLGVGRDLGEDKLVPLD